MEAFSLLKYWRGVGGVAKGAGTGGAVVGDVTNNDSTTTTTTIVTSVAGNLSESDEEGNADDGPFFDMEFTVRDEDGNESGDIEDIACVEDNEKDKDETRDSDDESDDGEEELKFTLSPASSGDSIDPNISLSPSDDLFFKGRLVPLTEPNCKPVIPLKSATKLRVLMLKLKKSTKLNLPKPVESEKKIVQNPKKQSEKEEIKQQSKQPAKFFTVKFKVEEVPMLSMFTRENSSKVANTKSQKQNAEKLSSVEDEKVFSKDVMNKYLKKVKPLYFRVSKRYGEKLGFSGHLSLSRAMKAGIAAPSAAKSESESRKTSESSPRPNEKNQKLGISFPAKLGVVRKHLGKSKSATSTVTAADSTAVPIASKRRDDSLLQQQDGIQSAIMHCKRSFKASRELDGSGLLLRSVSAEANEKSVNFKRHGSEG